jgi:hypothetical protein
VLTRTAKQFPLGFHPSRILSAPDLSRYWTFRIKAAHIRDLPASGLAAGFGGETVSAFVDARAPQARYIPLMFKPGDKVVVFQYDGKEFRGIVILTETLTSGVKVRVRSGDFILNVDEKQVSPDE